MLKLNWTEAALKKVAQASAEFRKGIEKQAELIANSRNSRDVSDDIVSEAVSQYYFLRTRRWKNKGKMFITELFRIIGGAVFISAAVKTGNLLYALAGIAVYFISVFADRGGLLRP